MSNLTFLYIVFGLIFSVQCYWALIFFMRVVSSYKDIQRNKRYPSLVSLRDGQMCPGFHKWDCLTLALRGLDPGNYTVCYECGVVSGNYPTFLGLNGPGLEMYREKRKFKAERLARGEKDEDFG